MQGNEPPLPKSRWRVLKEGEVSPFKIITSIFIRENYSHIELRRGTPEERSNILMLIYRLITSYDMSFNKLKSILEDPEYKVRPEVLRRFLKVISTLEEDNAGYLYELVHSIIDMEGSQTVILRKRIGKNSPFGKFLRIVLMNVRKMSYPQICHLYGAVCLYVDLVGIKRLNLTISSHKGEACVDYPDSHSSTSTLREEDVENYNYIEALKRKSTEIKLYETKSLELKISSKHPFKPGHMVENSEGGRKRGLDIFHSLMQKKKLSNSTGLGLSLYRDYTIEYLKATGKLTPELEAVFEEEKREKAERANINLQKLLSLRANWQSKSSLPKPFLISSHPSSQQSSQGQSPTDVPRRRQSQRSKSKPKSPGKQKVDMEVLTMLQPTEEGYFISDDEEGLLSPEEVPVSVKKSKRASKKSQRPSKSDSLFHCGSFGDNVPASRRWDQVKNWSRKQIERRIKAMAADLYHTGSRRYTPQQISAFVEAIQYNPSSQILLPQLHYLEYLNCLRIKDLRRCAEALRTSFDLRIKPNTSELNKGTPYAAYNFAVFYNIMGYKQDASQFLEEAFKAGHGAGDATCLHYCHNLWSTFHNKPYTDAIVTVTKEVDKNMAYLHSLNVISNAFDYHYQRLPPEEIIYTLWHYNAECDLEEVESLLLLSVASFFTVFGWHKMVPFTCQIILRSSLNWPTKAWCAALCLFAQNLLVQGETVFANKIMEFGDKYFTLQTSPDGELFGIQKGIFSALSAYLAYHPVDPETISSIMSFNKSEALYWKAYSKMVGNDWDEAGRLVKELLGCLSATSCENNDIKIRCLLLQAELRCLAGTPTNALKYLFEALDLSYQIFSDFYTTLCLINISCVQCQLGLVSCAMNTIHMEIRSVIRSNCPVLESRMTIVNVKLRLNHKESPIDKEVSTKLLESLCDMEQHYKNWGNNYRLKEILYLKCEILERVSSGKDKKTIEGMRKEMEALETVLPWSPSTSIL